jgi:hypothetical protein
MPSGQDRSIELSLKEAAKRNYDSITCSSNCARFNPARALLGLPVWSWSIRRSAAAIRSRARSRSATEYWRGSARVRFPRGPLDALLASDGRIEWLCGRHSTTPIFRAGCANQTYLAQPLGPSPCNGGLWGHLGRCPRRAPLSRPLHNPCDIAPGREIGRDSFA